MAPQPKLKLALYWRAGTFGAPQVKPAAKQQADAQQVPEEQPSAAADYIVIADRNLFHPERIIPIEKKEEKPLPKPDFVLYGTLIDGETKLAFMDDLKAPYTTPGRGKRQRTIAKGGNLSGYVLSEVHEDKVVMVRGEEKIPVILDDKLHKRKGPAETTTAQSPAAGRKNSSQRRLPRWSGRPEQPQVHRQLRYRNRLEEISVPSGGKP